MKRAIPVLLTMLVLAPTLVLAADDGSTMYVDMCMQSAAMPPPYGEGDLKDNPKLRDYCTCFSKLFFARAMSSKTLSAGEAMRGEREMRITCRKQYGLPPPK